MRQAALRPPNVSRQVHHPENKLCRTLGPVLPGRNFCRRCGSSCAVGFAPWFLWFSCTRFPRTKLFLLENSGSSVARTWHGSVWKELYISIHSLCIWPGHKALATWSLWSYKTKQVLEHQVQLTLMIDLTPGVLFIPLFLPVPLSTMAVWHFQQDL